MVIPHPPLPHPEQEWRAHLAAGRIMIQRSRTTGEYVFYPRVAAPGSGAEDLEWVPVSGRGTVHAATIVRKKPPEPGVSIVLVDLEEGPRLMSSVVDTDPETVGIGMAVQARIESEGDGHRLVFALA